MESTENIERAVRSARGDVAKDQQAVSHEILPGDPVLASRLQRDEAKMQRLEKEEDRSRQPQQDRGFGF
jgi:LPS O-antigen subunit length determinant protein (WzzB/FepE family)